MTISLTAGYPCSRPSIRRAGKPCGLFLQLQGPRLLETFAIWAGQELRVQFYGSAGQRYYGDEVERGAGRGGGGRGIAVNEPSWLTPFSMDTGQIIYAINNL
jgi:hypothetical protein